LSVFPRRPLLLGGDRAAFGKYIEGMNFRRFYWSAKMTAAGKTFPAAQGYVFLALFSCPLDLKFAVKSHSPKRKPTRFLLFATSFEMIISYRIGHWHGRVAVLQPTGKNK
jgi:hypothetical protein